MDSPRPILLGLLATAASCASWTPGAEFEDPASPQPFTPSGEADVVCAGTPEVRLAAERVLVLRGCSPRVAVFRRDVLEGSDPELLGWCDLPCADQPGNGVFAYSIARLDDEERAGQRSPEIFVSVETSTGPR
jgi:hypothetical protein